jgi:predicted MFS family arabinose efflux permease
VPCRFPTAAMTSRSRPLPLALGGMIAMAAAMGIGRFVYTPILPYMADALSLSPGDAGLIASANFLGYVVGALAAATGILSGDRRAWALAALAASAATTAAMAATAALPLFLLLRFAGGVASAFVMVFGSALVFDRLAEAGRPNLSNVHFAGVGLGIAISAVAVAAVGSAGGWAGQWLLSGAVAAAGFAAVLFLVPTGTGTTPAPAAVCARTGRAAAPLVVAYGFFGFGYVITATFISAMVRATPAIASVEPVVWLAVGLAAIPSVALWTWIGRRIGNRASFALACLVEAAGVAASVAVAHPAAALVGAVLLGGTFMGLTALGLIMGRGLASGDPRRMLAILTASFGLGQMLGPVFAGYLSEITGSYAAPSYVAAALLVAAAGLARLIPRPSTL